MAQATEYNSSMPSSSTLGQRARIVVLASGGGSNCQALIDASAAAELDAEIVAVISNNARAGVLDRAMSAGIETRVIDHSGKDPAVRQQADVRLVQVVEAYAPDLVVLAGWMRILGANVGAALPMINLHPAKPGEFPGVQAIERAYQAWEAGDIGESGVMVHWVPDEGVDVGPVLVCESVGFEAGDSLDQFAARMHKTEHRLIVEGATAALLELAAAAAD